MITSSDPRITVSDWRLESISSGAIAPQFTEVVPDPVTTAHSELRAGINIWIKDWIFSYHLLQRKLNFIASPQLYAALNSYTSVMVGRGEVSLFSGIHSACVACVYNCVVRSSPKIFWITCAININSVGCAAHNTVVNTGNTGRMNAAEQTHLTSSNQAVAWRVPKAENLRSSREFSFLKYFLHWTGKIINIIIWVGIGRSNENGKR